MLHSSQQKASFSGMSALTFLFSWLLTFPLPGKEVRDKGRRRLVWHKVGKEKCREDFFALFLALAEAHPFSFWRPFLLSVTSRKRWNKSWFNSFTCAIHHFRKEQSLFNAFKVSGWPHDSTWFTKKITPILCSLILQGMAEALYFLLSTYYSRSENHEGLPTINELGLADPLIIRWSAYSWEVSHSRSPLWINHATLDL